MKVLFNLLFCVQLSFCLDVYIHKGDSLNLGADSIGVFSYKEVECLLKWELKEIIDLRSSSIDFNKGTNLVLRQEHKTLSFHVVENKDGYVYLFYLDKDSSTVIGYKTEMKVISFIELNKNIDFMEVPKGIEDF